MFFTTQEKENQNKYINQLQTVGKLSNLFSDSDIPYLYYRVAEKIFCNSFVAQDLSRGDVSYDAKKGSLGIGLKTFLKNNDKTIQKIAEFNKDINLYKHLNNEAKIRKIAELRNSRLAFTNNVYNINKSIYHCVLREKNSFSLFEEEIKAIDLETITNIQQKKNTIYFNDNNYEYAFSLSKSTLQKRFHTNNILVSFDVNIIDNPLNLLDSCLQKIDSNLFTPMETIYLPLYGRNKKVYDASGLNQWNANGRERDSDEIYIPIPSKFYKFKSDFFPPKDEIFSLTLPNNGIIQAKVCQDNSKALMSNPNKVLGKWLLRDVLQLKEGTIVTNELLEQLGIDSVRIDKVNEKNYIINFASTGSYENFINKFEE